MRESTEAILRDRFFHEGETSWEEVCKRVSEFWSTREWQARRVYDMMTSGDGLPNTPAISNAGLDKAMGSACYVLPIHDSLTDGESSIMGTLRDAAAVHQSGGGTGFDFSEIRPRGALVRSTGRPAPGPLNMLQLYSDAISRVTQGGLRPGANMAIIRVDHPDVLDFVRVKAVEGTIHNFNISIALTDEFMEAVASLDPEAVELFDEITYYAWLNGEPGAFFVDRVNEKSLHPEPIAATNPCGEVPLRPYEACVLGSINIANHVQGGLLDIIHLEDTVHTMVELLDDIIENQTYPLPQIEREQKRYRKIGVGIMGLADAMALCDIDYNSLDAVKFAADVAEQIKKYSYRASGQLASARGAYDGYTAVMPWRRNLNCQVIAPTGTISRLAECSFGIEPHFDVDFDGNMESYVVGGKGLDEHGRMIPFLDHQPFHNSEHFRPASQVPLNQHLAIQAAVQQYTDQAVSKTINCPHSTTHADIKRAYIDAWQSGLKGVTVLRAGSRENVVLGVANETDEPPVDELCASGACEL